MWGILFPHLYIFLPDSNKSREMLLVLKYRSFDVSSIFLFVHTLIFFYLVNFNKM